MRKLLRFAINRNRSKLGRKTGQEWDKWLESSSATRVDSRGRRMVEVGVLSVPEPIASSSEAPFV